MTTRGYNGVGALGGQGGGGAGPGSDRCGWLRVADLRRHVVGLPALQLLLDQPLHLIPVAFWVATQTLILKIKRSQQIFQH